MNILAFGAHPGDVESMCGGALLKYRQQGHNIFIAVTTSGNISCKGVSSREEAATICEKEQLEAAKTYDAQVRFLRFDEGGVQDTPEARRAFLTAIRWANPDVILCCPPWDTNIDRSLTGRLITQVILSVGGKQHPADLPPISKTPKIFFYDVPGGIGFQPEVYVNTTETMGAKLESLKAYESQGTELYEHILALGMYRGHQTACKYAEAFVSHKMYAFMSDPRMLP